MARKHVIYGLYDPTDPRKKVRYVGYTHFTPEQRIIDHVSTARRKTDTHKQKWIRKLLRNNVVPAYMVLEVTTAKDWKARERYWIAAFLARGNKLTNSTDGGEGLVNPSKDVRKRISKKVSIGLVGNQRRKGVPHTPEVIARFVETRKTSKKWKAAWRKRRGQPGHPMSEANKEALRISNVGRARPDNAQRLKKQAKKNRGSFWVNDGIENRLLRKGESVPEGFTPGRLMQSQMTTKGAQRITNGVENRMLSEGDLIPRGFRFGMVKDESWRTPNKNKNMGAKIREQKTGYRWIKRGKQRRQLLRNEPLPTGWGFVKVE